MSSPGAIRYAESDGLSIAYEVFGSGPRAVDGRADPGRRYVELPGDDRWHTILDRHDALVRRHLERHRGREVKATGDGFLGTFDGPARAVRCAQAIVGGVAALDLAVGPRSTPERSSCVARTSVDSAST